MDKFLHLLIYIPALTYLTSAQPSKTQDGVELQTNELSDELLYVKNSRDSPELTLSLDDFSAIAESALRDLKIDSLTLNQLNSENCIPKFINSTSESFVGPSELVALNLECVKFPVIQDLFKHLKSVEGLGLKRVEFAGFSQEHFADFPNLSLLTLEDLNITTISPDIFSKINEQLTILTIADNINAVEPQSFARFHNLAVLILQGGELAYLPDEMFTGLDNLIMLDLTNNGIKTLTGTPFISLPKLQSLDLHSNKISAIEANTFYYNDLHLLDFSHNKLQNIPEGAIHYLPNLGDLDLSFNEISIIIPGDIVECPELRTLKLNDNKIQKIEFRSFEDLHLNKLSLINNNINILGGYAFYGLQVDEVLDLHGNNITEIEPNAFSGLKAKQVLLCYRGSVDNNIQTEWGIEDNSVEKLVNDRCEE